MTILNPTVDFTGLEGVGQGKHVVSPDDGTLLPITPAWETAFFGYHLCAGFHDQFNGTTSEFITTVSGTGANVLTGPSVTNFPGSYIHGVGSTTTGRSARSYQLAGGLLFGSTSGLFRFEAAVTQITALSDGTDPYVFRIGVLDSITGVPVDGMYFEMDANADPQIQCVARSNNVETRVDSGVTIAISTTYRLLLLITNDTQVDFFISSSPASVPTLVATITTNIPSGASRLSGIASSTIKGGAGTNERRTEVHYYVWDLDRVGL